MNKATHRVIAQFSRAMGNPVSTPEWISVGGGRVERAGYRVWRWRCPVCRGGFDDPDGIWKPLFVDSDGRVACEANDCALEKIVHEAQILCDIADILDSVEVPG